MSQTWKRFSGINHMDKTNNITVKTLVADTFTIRDALSNDFEVGGTLSVTNGAEISQGINVIGTSSIQSLEIASESNLTMNGGDLFFNKTGGFDGSGFFLTASGEFLGVNNRNPTATIDIKGNTLSSINVYTSANRNSNILARNLDNNQIVLDVDGSYNGSVIFDNNNTNNAAIKNNYNPITDENVISITEASLTMEKGGRFTDNKGLNGLHIDKNTINYFNDNHYVNKLPTQVFSSGSKYVNQIGFNMMNPEDDYVVSINGPTQMRNNQSFQIRKVEDVSFNHFAYSKSSFTHNIVILDNSKNILKTNSSSNSYEFTNITNDIVLNSAFVADASKSILVANLGFMYFSNDGSNSFKQIAGGPDASFQCVYISNNNDVIVGDSNGKLHKFNIDFDSDFDSNDVVNITSTVSTIDVDESSSIQSMDGYLDNVYFTNSKGIYYYDSSDNTDPTLIHDGSFDNIRIFDTHLGIATYSLSNNIAYKNNDSSWNNVDVEGASNINDGFIIDASRGVVVGSNGMFYSNDGFNNWHKISVELLGITNDDNTVFNSVYMPDEDTFVFVYSLNEDIYFHQTFAPIVLNQENSVLLQLYGNTQLNGNLVLDTNSEIRSTEGIVKIGTNQTTQLDSTTMNNAFVRNMDVSNVDIFNGNVSQTLKIIENGVLDVSGSTILNNMSVINDAQIDGSLNVQTDLVVGRTFTVTGIDIEKGLLLQW